MSASVGTEKKWNSHHENFLPILLFLRKSSVPASHFLPPLVVVVSPLSCQSSVRQQAGSVFVCLFVFVLLRWVFCCFGFYDFLGGLGLWSGRSLEEVLFSILCFSHFFFWSSASLCLQRSVCSGTIWQPHKSPGNSRCLVIFHNKHWYIRWDFPFILSYPDIYNSIHFLLI